MRKVFLLVGVSLVCLRGANAQSFDVASIRPQAPEDARFYIRLPAKGRFTAMGSTAKLLMIIAFDVQESQIAGGPGWLTTEKCRTASERISVSPESRWLDLLNSTIFH